MSDSRNAAVAVASHCYDVYLVVAAASQRRQRAVGVLAGAAGDGMAACVGANVVAVLAQDLVPAHQSNPRSAVVLVLHVGRGAGR